MWRLDLKAGGRMAETAFDGQVLLINSTANQARRQSTDRVDVEIGSDGSLRAIFGAVSCYNKSVFRQSDTNPNLTWPLSFTQPSSLNKSGFADEEGPFQCGPVQGDVLRCGLSSRATDLNITGPQWGPSSRPVKDTTHFSTSLPIPSTPTFGQAWGLMSILTHQTHLCNELAPAPDPRSVLRTECIKVGEAGCDRSVDRSQGGVVDRGGYREEGGNTGVEGTGDAHS